MENDFLSIAKSLEPWMIERRRDFHRHPELGFQEVRTASIVAQELNALGLEVRPGVAKTGVVALLEGDRPGPTVLARFDMDALPIDEANQTDYISTAPGVMHACGHDGHTAIGLAVARMLATRRSEIAGTIKFVFQPAEEGLGGGEMMVKEGVLENPKPDLSLALHVWNSKPVGWVGVAEGPTMAASERFIVRLAGKGGHGAIPQLALDPVVAAAHVITALQTIVSRNVNPLESGVLSVTAVKSGEAFNVIPDRVELRGTIRSFKPEVRETLLRRVREVAQGVGQALGCSIEVETWRITPPVVNDAKIAADVRELAANLVGGENVQSEITMGSEDMAFMMETIPGCYFFIGSADAERDLNYPHHHPRFDFDERALVTGAALMAAALAKYVNL